jgi:hypothetical protein
MRPEPYCDYEHDERVYVHRELEIRDWVPSEEGEDAIEPGDFVYEMCEEDELDTGAEGHEDKEFLVHIR